MPNDTQLLDIVALDTVEEAARKILGEDLNGITSGAKVAIIDDHSTYPYAGLVGRVVGPVNAGHVDVEFPNGARVPVQVNQLIVVPV
jgi:hypothetical protein